MVFGSDLAQGRPSLVLARFRTIRNLFESPEGLTLVKMTSGRDTDRVENDK